MQYLPRISYGRSLENEVLRDGERDLYVKQTYSVHRNDVSDDTVGVGLIASGSTSGKESGEKSGEGKGGSGEGKKEKRKPRKWHLSESSYFKCYPAICFYRARACMLCVTV